MEFGAWCLEFPLRSSGIVPELPEVETTVKALNKKVLGRAFLDVWTNWKKQIKKPANFEQFKKEIKGKKIENIKRRGKNILFKLSGDKTLLIHQKMTGHLLIGNWKLEVRSWKPLTKGPLEEPVNKFIHLMFWLSGGLMLTLSDLRKFAKVELWDSRELLNSKEFSSLGPEPLKKNFTFEKFKSQILSKKAAKGEPRQRRGKIKQVLMDQTVLAGIGNIYSDEILWEAKVNPLKKVDELGVNELMRIYKAMQKVLRKAIKLKGDSMSDYRLITGEKGGYQKIQKVYRQEGKPCQRKDNGIIKRIKIGGRSAHFCPVCQK